MHEGECVRERRGERGGRIPGAASVSTPVYRYDIRPTDRLPRDMEEREQEVHVHKRGKEQ